MKTPLHILFEKYFDKTASPEEEQAFFALLQEESSDEELEQLLRTAFHEYEQENPYFDAAITTRMLECIREQTVIKNHKRYFPYWSYAAAVLVAIGLTLFMFYYINRPHSEVPDTQKVLVKSDVQPGNEKAVIVLADGRTVDVAAMDNGLNKDLGNTFSKEEKGVLDYTANGAIDEDVAFHTMQIPKGGQYQLVLSDGSKVWLNAASSIRYPTRFKGGSREVTVTGEAYFEVSHQPEKPFFVNTDGQRIQVLGTHFNVRAYADEAQVKTTLLTGSVQLVDLKTKKNRRLRPGEEASFSDKGTWNVTPLSDASVRIGWTKGYFAFNEADLETVLRELSRWYDVDFKLKSKTSKTYTGKIDRNLPLSELMNGLAISGIPIEIEDETHRIELPNN